MLTRPSLTCWRMIWANVRARPARTTLCVFGVALQVVLILLTVGMIDGVVSEWGRRVEGVGADLLVRPPGSSIFFSLSSASIPEEVGQRIAQVSGVRAVAPVLITVDPRTLDIIYGIDLKSFEALSDGFHLLAGSRFEQPNDLLVDDIKARTAHLRVGQRVHLLGEDFWLRGIVESGKGARLFLPLHTAQQLVGADSRVSMFYVRTDGDTEGVARRLVQQLPGYRILSMEEYLTLMNSSNLPDLQPFVDSMILLGLAIGVLVIFLTTYTVILERTHEIGILKSLGASRQQVAGFVLRETLLIAALGVGLGLAATWATQAILRRELPSLTILLSWRWIGETIAIAVLGALVGGLYPALRAAALDPIEALAYE